MQRNKDTNIRAQQQSIDNIITQFKSVQLSADRSTKTNPYAFLNILSSLSPTSLTGCLVLGKGSEGNCQLL